MEKDKISLEQSMALEDAIAYLEDLADGFRAAGSSWPRATPAWSWCPPTAWTWRWWAA
jgi:hypothetical protein